MSDRTEGIEGNKMPSTRSIKEIFDSLKKRVSPPSNGKRKSTKKK